MHKEFNKRNRVVACMQVKIGYPEDDNHHQMQITDKHQAQTQAPNKFSLVLGD